MKHIITLIDGTSRNARVEQVHSNIYRLNLAIRERGFNKSAGRFDDQVVFYYPGIGTSLTKDRIAAKLFGRGLIEIVKDSYVNIASNFYKGDKIYIFGFSRGAIAARILAGFIGKFGLLRAEHVDMLNLAWSYYEEMSFDQKRMPDFGDWLRARGFERAGSSNDFVRMDMEIEFLGLFDPVPGGHSVERSMQRRFGMGNSMPAEGVIVAIQLLSIDETRPYFRPLLWNAKLQLSDGHWQTVEQIWMPGVHTDIGGGYDNNFLANVAFLTMIDKMRQYNIKLSFYEEYISGIERQQIDNFKIIMINNETNIPYRIRKIMGLVKRRVIEFSKKEVLAEFMRDEVGVYNSIHPLALNLIDKQIVFRDKNRVYSPTNLRLIDLTECFPTKFYNQKRILAACRIN